MELPLGLLELDGLSGKPAHAGSEMESARHALGFGVHDLFVGHGHPVQLGRLERQRGQTMPFWVVGVLIVLTLLFFVANYGASIIWQIRAQNAADSAASTALTVQANLWNEENTILYSASLDEYRLRALNQAILNTIN